ncbi:MAG: hypothetical protein A2W19_02175 [Spirochaetes bacterium RBG_16_49_21]|nr:MAG: hypothetical protein A2W19_02175 [Spirochaetes bacterium RBG_16_49_21]
MVFINNVYNFEILLQKKVHVNLETYFYNLPLTLNHKNNIRQTFKDFTSNLSFDLSIYRQYFDNMDQEYKDEKQSIKDSIQKVLLNSEGRKFMSFLDTKLDELADEIKEFSGKEHEKHGFYFRKLLWNYILCSEFMTRTNLKPRGYVGDSEMMRMIYENDYWGETTFAKLMHKHPIEHPAAQAVRNRRLLIPKVLHETMNNFPHLPNRGFRILSVASGPATELQDLLATADDFNKFSFTLFDQDTSALMEAARGIEQIEKMKNSKAKVTYLKDSVRTMLKTSKISEKWGQFHYIYSMGLFDYLTPPVAAVLLQKLYELLIPGGQLFVGNYSVNNPSRYYMEYWCDWVLYYRTEEEFLNLLNDNTAKKSVYIEDSGSQMFLQIKKEG